MSSEVKNIQAFIYLLENDPSIVENYREELEQLSVSCSEDLKEVSDAIALWCEDKELDEALIAAHNAIDNNATDSVAEQERIFNSHIEPVSPSQERQLIVTTVKNKMQRDSQSSNSSSDASSKPPSQT